MNEPLAVPVVVIGAGGHAKVVVSILQAAGHTVAALYDDDARTWGRQVLGSTVRGPVTELGDNRHRAVIGIGDNRIREQFSQRLASSEWATAVHPTAYVHPSVRLGPGAVVCAGAVIQPDATIGAHAIINTGVTVDHDCVIGDFAHLAPGTHLAGNVVVGRGVLLGVGCAVIPGCQIGDWATVGAGGVVVHDLPPGVTAVGVPARPVTVGDERSEGQG